MARMHHLGITVSDTYEAIGFYQLLADVEVTGPFIKTGPAVDAVTGLADAQVGWSFLNFEGGSPAIELVEYHRANIAPIVPDNIRAGVTHPAIVVDDLAAVLGRVRQAGYETTAAPFVCTSGPIAGFRYVYVIGPDELRGELLEAPHET